MTLANFTATLGSFSATLSVKAAAVPQYRSNQLIDLMHSAFGYDEVDTTRLLTPVLNKRVTRKEFVTALREKRFEEADVLRVNSLLKHLYRNQVKDWLQELAAQQLEGADTEGTPEQDLSDTADYWGAYAGKFCKVFMKLRAIKHEGQMLFLADDVAAVYSKAYGTMPVAKFLQDVLHNIKCTKNRTLTKMTYQEILARAPESAVDKAGMKQGKWFLSEDLMMLVLQQSTRPAAMEFRQHLIDVLKGRAENMLTFKAKKIAVRSNRTPEDILENDTRALARCRVVCRARNANPQAAVGQVTIGLLGTRLSSYAAAHGIKHPHRKNLILEMPEVGDLLEASLSLGNHVVANSTKDIEGDVKVGIVYHAAGRMTQLSNQLDSRSLMKAVKMLESMTAKA